MNEPNAKVLSGYKEIAAFLGVSTKTIQRHRKTIPVAQLGGRILILQEDLLSWVQEKIKNPTLSRHHFRLSK